MLCFLRKRNINIIIIVEVIAALIAILAFPVNGVDTNSYDFSNLSESDCMAFIEDHMIEIPADLLNLDNLPKLTQKLILQSYETPNVPFNFNYSQIQIYAEEIRAAVNRYIDSDVLPMTISETVYSLQNSKVQDASGSWVVNGGVFDSRWLDYNCYAYSIKREERSGFYGTMFPYDPGVMSGAGTFTECEDVWDLAYIVKADLLAMGYTGVDLYGILPSNVPSSKGLICVRMNKEECDYHFMKYDHETDAWYHKPGKSAVLKYNYTPTNSIAWNDEHFFSDGVYAPTFEYDESIVFITYKKNQINVGQNSPTEININVGKDVFCEISISNATYHWVNLNSVYSIEYEIYDENFDVVFDGTGTEINLSLTTPGVYYLRMNYTSNTVSHNVNVIVEPHTHSYDESYTWLSGAQHKSSCECSRYVKRSHVVFAGAFDNGASRVRCLLCKGLATSGVEEPLLLSSLPYSINGSYILPNGTIVLVPEDMEAYMNGTLEFLLGEIK